MHTPRPGEDSRPRGFGNDRPAWSPVGEPRAPAGYEDPVDEASADSMIASDPPARSGLRLGPAKRPRRRSG